jgi:hypothetical protein
MMNINPDLPALWWTQTTFGSIVIVMIFLTWGLVIIDLALVGLVILNKLFAPTKEKSSKKPS